MDVLFLGLQVAPRYLLGRAADWCAEGAPDCMGVFCVNIDSVLQDREGTLVRY